MVVMLFLDSEDRGGGGTRVFCFCCLVFFVVGSLKDEPGRPVSE